MSMPPLKSFELTQLNLTGSAIRYAPLFVAVALRQVKDLDQTGVRIALVLKSPARGSQVFKTLDTELASQLGAVGF